MFMALEVMKLIFDVLDTSLNIVHYYLQFFYHIYLHARINTWFCHSDRKVSI